MAIYSSQGMLKLDVEGIVKDYKDERMPLMTYSQVPFKVPGILQIFKIACIFLVFTSTLKSCAAYSKILIYHR